MQGIYNYRRRDSSVGIATDYGLDDPEIESLWGRYFPLLSRPALGPTQPPIQLREKQGKTSVRVAKSQLTKTGLSHVCQMWERN